MVYLKIEHDVALRRILKRKKHFMPPSLLESQIKILEEPKKALEIDSNLKVNQISEIIVKKFFLNFIYFVGYLFEFKFNLLLYLCESYLKLV